MALNNQDEFIAEVYHAEPTVFDKAYDVITSKGFMLTTAFVAVVGVTFYVAKEDTRNKIKINLTKEMITMSKVAIQKNLNINCYVPVLEEIMNI